MMALLQVADSMWRDLRYGIRMLWKNPGFTTVAVISLAVGIGANTAIFSLVDKLLVRSLPVRQAEQLVLLSAESVNPRFLNTIFSWPDFVDYREQNQVLSGLTALNQIEGKLGMGAEAEKVRIEMVSGNYFDVLGVRVAQGRAFSAEEDKTPGAHPVAVLSYGLWRRRFGADASLIGKTVVLNDDHYTVIGIAPKGFTGLKLEFPTEVWVPLMMRPQLMPGTVSLQERRMAWLTLIGRLKPGVTWSQAEAHLDLLARQIREAYTRPSDRHLPFYERRILLEPCGKGISFLRKKLNDTLRLLLAVVGLLLFIACANVSTLLLARSTARRKEIAVRLALGASRARLIQQLLTESLLLALVGASAGLLCAPYLHELLLAFQPNINLSPTVLSRSLDARVLGFALLVSILSGVIFGLVPALQSSRSDLAPALKGADHLLRQHERRWNARHLLVIAQVALALVVLIGAGLFIRSLSKLLSIDPGFRTENVFVIAVELPRERYAGGRSEEFFRRVDEKNNAFFNQLAERLKALPGVEAVSTAGITPLSGSVGVHSVFIEGYQPRTGETIAIDFNKVGPGYHELMGIPIVRGRGFTERDRAGAPGVVIINEAMARLYFPDRNPLGKRMRLGTGEPWLEIIGVIRDFRIRQLTETPIPHFDLPSLQNPYGTFVRVLIRTSSEPANPLAAARREVRVLDPGALVVSTGTLAEELRNSIAPARIAAALTSLFGLMGLLLAVIGLYGVMAYSVNRRTHEIGIRMALGAQRNDVLKLVVRQGMILVLIGVAIGLAAAFALTRVMSSLLYGVSTTDPVTFVSMALLFAAVALLASYIPARRAAKMDPMVALRYE